jgi:acrosin
MKISGRGQKGFSGVRGKARARRRRPEVEHLENRALLSVDITTFNVAAGTVTFTGDVGNKKDSLTLSETQVGGAFYLTHNLFGNGGTGNYADNMDVDPSSGYARIQIGSGTAPLITVNLGAQNDTLTLANSWTFRHKIAYDGGTGSNVLQGPNSALTWNLTGSSSGAFSGNIIDATKLTFTGVETLRGGTATDTLVGENVNSTWSLAGTASYNDGSSSLAFSGFDVLQGGSGANSFLVTANTTATLKGGSGSDAFTLGAGITLSGSIDGGAGSDTLSLGAYTSAVSTTLSSASTTGFSGTSTGVSGGFSGIDSVVGGSGSDVLTGANLTAAWTLNGTPTYTAGGSTLGFTGFETLQGGSGNDTFSLLGDGLLQVSENLYGGAGDDSFNFADGVFVTGSIDGQGGSDTLNYASYSAGIAVTLTGPASTNGYAGNQPLSIGGTFAGIDALTGSSAPDSLIGEDADSTWTIGTTRTYRDNAVSNSLTFSSFENLQGGSGADLFDIAVDPGVDLYGGAGNDTFKFRDGVTSTGHILGQSGSDTLDLNLYTTARSIALTAPDSSGFTGTDGVSAGFSGIDTVIGGSAADTLTGLATGTWNLGATQTYVSSSTTLTFSSFQSLQGGSGVDSFNILTNTTANLSGNNGNDSFVFANGAVLSGTATGGTGNDTLDMTAYTSNVALTLTGSTASGFSGSATAVSSFSAMDTILAGSGANNTVTGENVASTWTVRGAGSTYSDGNRGLSITSFQTFQGGSGGDTFNVTSSATAALRGGAGADSFNLGDGVTLTGSIAGEAGNDTLSMAAYTTFTSVSLTGSDTTNGFAGSATDLTAGFSGINAVTAGSTDSDMLTGRDVASTWTLDSTKSYSDGTATLTFSGFEELQGGSGADTFNIKANITADLMGGDGDDTFNFMTDGVTLNGTMDGENGVNALNYTGYTTPVTIDLASGLATGTNGFASIDSVTGGSGSNTVVGSNLPNSWSISGTNVGSVSGLDTLAFSSFANLIGGASADTFAFADGAGITGSLDGGGGNDIMSFAAFSAAHGVTFNISANNAGTVSAAGVAFSFKSIGNLVGGAGNDSFVFGNGRTLSGTLSGGPGTDTLDYSAYTTSVRVNLATGAATGINGGALGSITGIENVAGGSGNDILVGDSGNNTLTGNGGNDILVGNDGIDTLQGGDGRDILIGGNGSDALDGSTGEDLLIAGRTTYDNSLADLNALMAEWGRTDADYATRIAHLNGTLSGGRNGTRVLNATTVFDDGGAVDNLTGGADLDWFIVFTNDVIVDLNNGGTETVTQLDQTPSSPSMQSADLTVAMVASTDTVVAGSPLTYTVTVANNGPSPATGVALTGTLPAGAALVSAASSSGDLRPAGSQYTAFLGTIAAGNAATLTIIVRPTVAGAMRLSACVQSDQRNGSSASMASMWVVVDGPTVERLTLSERGSQLTSIVMTFSGPLDPTKARDLRNYRLVALGPDHRFGTRDDRVVRLRSALYNSSYRSVTLIPRRRLPRALPLELTADGPGAPGLPDEAGNLLDGDNDGHPGGPYAALISGTTLGRAPRHRAVR